MASAHSYARPSAVLLRSATGSTSLPSSCSPRIAQAPPLTYLSLPTHSIEPAPPSPPPPAFVSHTPSELQILRQCQVLKILIMTLAYCFAVLITWL
jgi:hypothetical protein